MNGAFDALELQQELLEFKQAVDVGLGLRRKAFHLVELYGMQVDVAPGKYVIAVSGGVDSMVLLDVLTRQPKLQLIVAHYDHGIREDSAQDRQLVQRVAAQHGLPFEYEEGRLGANVGEAAARTARYAFLERVRSAHGARAIMTAHHQDDVLETAIVNIIRGTGRKGLTSLASRSAIIRPMLHITRRDILAHAQRRGLAWREDSSNADERYLRNYVRHRLLPRFSAEGRGRLLAIIERMRPINDEIDGLLINLMQTQPWLLELDRSWFIQLPHAIAKEFLAGYLRARGIGGFDARTLERVVIAAKVQQSGVIDIIGEAILLVRDQKLALARRER